jgi:hypothetical protein
MNKGKKKLGAELGTFLRQYSRKAHAGHDPNDRSYDRKLEALVKRLKPEEFDALLNGESDENNDTKLDGGN